MPVRRATGQSLRGYSTSIKSTEQVPDAHRGSSLVLHYVTKVWSDDPRDWPGLQTARRRSNGYISTIRLPEAPSNVKVPVLAGAAGPGIILAGYPDRPPEKLTACYRHGRIDPHPDPEIRE
jgi:hypothetical protein